MANSPCYVLVMSALAVDVLSLEWFVFTSLLQRRIYQRCFPVPGIIVNVFSCLYDMHRILKKKSFQFVYRDSTATISFRGGKTN